MIGRLCVGAMGGLIASTALGAQNGNAMFPLQPYVAFAVSGAGSGATCTCVPYGGVGASAGVGVGFGLLDVASIALEESGVGVISLDAGSKASYRLGVLRIKLRRRTLLKAGLGVGTFMQAGSGPGNTSIASGVRTAQLGIEVSAKRSHGFEPALFLDWLESWPPPYEAGGAPGLPTPYRLRTVRLGVALALYPLGLDWNLARLR